MIQIVLEQAEEEFSQSAKEPVSLRCLALLMLNGLSV